MSQFSQVTPFANYLVNTRQARFKGPKDIVNELTLQNYTFPDFMRNERSGVTVKGGSELRDVIKITEFSNFRPYIPGEVRTPSRGPTDQEYIVPWRFFENDRPVTDVEVSTNKDDAYAQFKDFEHSLMMDLQTDHGNGLEFQLWQRPNQALMAARAQTPGALMLSIPAVMTENGVSAPGWGATNPIQELRPDLNPRWRNQVAVYDQTDPEHPYDGVLAAFTDCVNKTRYKSWKGKEQWMQGSSSMVNYGACFYTSLGGLNLYQNLLRASNDHTRFGPQDPAYPHPLFNRIPVKHCAALDEALLDQTGAVTGDPAQPGTYSGTPYPANRPRFFFVVYEWLKLWFKKGKLFNEDGPKDGGAIQRDVNTMFIESHCNTFTRSRRRLCIIRPAA